MTEGDAYNIACTSQYRANCPDKKGPDFDFGSSAILVALADGKRALIAGQKSGMVHALDPDHDGAILWQRRVGQGSTLGGVQWGMAVDDENLYVAVSDIGLERVAPGTPGAQKTIMGGELKMDPRQGGGLFALKLTTGEIVSHTPHPGCNEKPGCSPAQSAAVTAIPGVVFSGGLDGHLRAYAAKSGEIIWDIDTVKDYTTVNGAAAHGGSLDGPGAVVAGGMLYVNSGYTNYGTAPGNVLLFGGREVGGVIAQAMTAKSWSRQDTRRRRAVVNPICCISSRSAPRRGQPAKMPIPSCGARPLVARQWSLWLPAFKRSETREEVWRPKPRAASRPSAGRRMRASHVLHSFQCVCRACRWGWLMREMRDDRWWPPGDGRYTARGD